MSVCDELRRCGFRGVCACIVLSAAGCALFGAVEEEPAELEQLPVVAEDRPFDPSQAVDDDDDLERPWHRAGDPQAADAFAGTDSKVLNRADAKVEEATVSGGRLEDKVDPAKKQPPPKPDEKPGAKLPSDEHVASPVEVEGLLAKRRAAVDAIDREHQSDGARKAKLAWNPPAEEVGPSKSAAWTLVDYSLEGALLGLGALVVSVLVVLAKRFPRSVAAVVAGAVALVVWVLLAEGE